MLKKGIVYFLGQTLLDLIFSILSGLPIFVSSIKRSLFVGGNQYFLRRHKHTKTLSL